MPSPILLIFKLLAGTRIRRTHSPWLRLDPFLDIAGEVVIHYGGRSPGLQIGDYVGDHPAGRLGRFDHSDGAVPLLNDNLAALPDLSHDIGDIVHQFGFGHVDDGHISMIPVPLG